MIDDFMIRAALAGVGIALLTGPLGCHIVWQRLAYFGDTISHSALLGVAIALVLSLDLSLGVFVAAAGVALLLLLLGRRQGLPPDALLGTLAHGSLAFGLVILSFVSGARVDLVNVLFGDILGVSNTDVLVIYLVAGAILLSLVFIWRPLLAATVHSDLAAAEGVRNEPVRILFMLMVAATVAVSVKIVGVLLITAMLIIPAAAARRFAASPESMAILASLVGVLAVLGGLGVSNQFDTPTGPSIVALAAVLFLVSRLLPALAGGGRLSGRRARPDPATTRARESV